MRTISIAWIVIAVLLTLVDETAAAQEATPSPTGGGDVPRVTASREVTFSGRFLTMSPNGKWIATFDPENEILCAVDVASLGQKVTLPGSDDAQSCLTFEAHGIRSIAEDYVRWSPDGSRLVFTENGPVFFDDADIWVFTPETGEIVNLTDDGMNGGLLIFNDETGEPFNMDIVPAWSPDGKQIAFARSGWDGDWQGTQLMVVPADGSGEPEVISTVTTDRPMVVYLGMAFAPDGRALYYTYASNETDDPDNGVWAVSLTDGEAEQIAARTDPERGYPSVWAVSPQGDQLVTFDALYAGQYGPIDSPYATLDLESGEIEPLLASDPDEPTELVPVRVAYSPDGEWLVFTGTGTGVRSGIFIRPSSASGPGQDVALVDNSDDEYQFVGVGWAANGTIFAQTSPESGLVLTVSGGSEPPDIPQPPADGTPAASPLAVGPVDPAIVAAGTPLVTNDVVVLRSAPAPDAPVVTELPGGTALNALGPVEDGAGFRWIPVREPESGTIGYVRAELVSLATE